MERYTTDRATLKKIDDMERQSSDILRKKLWLEEYPDLAEKMEERRRGEATMALLLRYKHVRSVFVEGVFECLII